ncbi:DUF3854 domain-containing protein [Cellulomonas fimi]|uniref:DUF3854 domain-containing protein n=1 Tax=Cellulomonas fimi TaxID=1708 RepID=UPI00234C5AF9|nr:DUF3854 domain-containing protein [Cellulomonas fimi]MDC7120259.1 DUF3854 domain-containing protein [Cellulomonas fimi]
MTANEARKPRMNADDADVVRTTAVEHCPECGGTAAEADCGDFEHPLDVPAGYDESAGIGHGRARPALHAVQNNEPASLYFDEIDPYSAERNDDEPLTADEPVRQGAPDDVATDHQVAAVIEAAERFTGRPAREIEAEKKAARDAWVAQKRAETAAERENWTPPVSGLSDQHRAYLEENAVPVALALEAGTYTATDREHLPPTLRYVADQTRISGIVYAHHTLNGDVIYQYNPDKEVRVDPDQKYIQEGGVGSIVSVHPRMLALIESGRARSLVIVEGTKQYLAAVANAPDDTLIVGVQGCTSWSKEGNPLPVLDEFIEIVREAKAADDEVVVEAAEAAVEAAEATAAEKGTFKAIAAADKARRALVAAKKAAGTGPEAIVCFDADHATNRSVHDAATRLGSHLRTIGAGKVRYVRLPAGGKIGLDEYLAERKDRALAMLGLIRDAVESLGKAPAAKYKVAGRQWPTSNWEEGTIRAPGTVSEDGVVTPGSLVAGFAARIVETICVVDDLNPGRDQIIFHTLAVAIGKEGEPGRVEALITRVADADIENPRVWLRRIPDGAGTHAGIQPDRRSTDIIGTAIRVQGAAHNLRHLARSGWTKHDNRPVYSHADGALGADGGITDVRTNSSGPAGKISFPSLADDTPEQALADAREFIRLLAMLRDASSALAVLGAEAYSLTGAEPHAVLAITGPRGNGKTTLTECLGTLVGVALFGTPMVSFNSTGNAVGGARNGCHNAPLTVDDARKREHIAQQVQQAEALEQIIRTSYDGPGAARSRMVRDELSADGFSVAPTDKSWPYSIITAEVLPPASVVGSTVDRILSFWITATALWMVKGQADEWRDAAKSGLFNRIGARYVRHLARMAERDHGGDIAGVGAEAHRQRTEYEADVTMWAAEPNDGSMPLALTPRQAEVTAPPIVGLHWLLKSIEDATGMLADDDLVRELKALRFAVADGCMRAITRHATVEMGDDATGPEQMLGRVRERIASGKAYVGVGEGVCVGGTTKVAGVPCVALLPDTVAELLHTDHDTVIATLREVAIPDSDGKPTRVVRMPAAGRVRALCVPESVWCIAAPDDDPDVPSTDDF